MERLSKVLALVVIVTAFASCGIFRKTKHKERHTIEEVVKRDCVSMENATKKGEVKQREVDKGSVVTERTTTSVTEKGGKSKVTIGKGDLKHGENYLRDSAGNEVKAVLDTLGKTLTLEITTKGERTETTVQERITEQKDATKEREEKQDETGSKQVAVAVDQRREETSSESSSESKPSFWGIFGNWIGISVAVVIVLGFILWYWRKGKK